MNSQNDKRISNQFGSFCTRALKNEARNIHSEYERRRAHEKSLQELSSDEITQLSAEDKYFADEHIFNVLDKEVVVIGNLLADALRQLPPAKRDVILLSYFVGMSDVEIGKKLSTIQQTIYKRRTSTLRELRKLLEKEGIKWDDK